MAKRKVRMDTAAGRDAARDTVRKGYAAVAATGSTSSLTGRNCCCGTGDAAGVAKTVGYTDTDLANLPAGSNMGLSCGNPTAIACLRRGEVVLDLGSGGGFDIFIVAQKVGPGGLAIGVDMTPEMLSKARGNVPAFTRRTGLRNVEFRLGEIEHLPLADNSVDVVISNCVLNLSPDKPQVWREIARALKPGGRVAVSDLALLKPLPKPVLKAVTALVGCVAGAVLVEDTRKMAKAAGLTRIALTPKHEYIEGMEDWKDPWYGGIIKLLPKGRRLSDYVTSLNVEAWKPVDRRVR